MTKSALPRCESTQITSIHSYHYAVETRDTSISTAPREILLVSLSTLNIKVNKREHLDRLVYQPHVSPFFIVRPNPSDGDFPPVGPH